MAIKTKITSAEFATIDDTLKSHYQLQTDGTYSVDLGPGVFVTDKDPAGLMSALEKEREENKRVKAIADKLEAEKLAAETSKITDVEQLKAHFQQQLEERDRKAAAEKKEQEKAIAAQRQAAADQAAREQALRVASELFGTQAPLLLPHVQGMLRGQIGPDGTPRVEVVDPTTGLPSLDQNLESFKKSLSTNELFKPMVVVTKASGGSANDNKATGLATKKDDGTPKKYSDYNSGELVRLKREQPDLFQSLLDSRNTS